MLKYNVSPDCQINNLAQIYNELFPEITNGIFVEVGAFDGISLSNTSCLAELGWTGYYIEPVPSAYYKCKKRYQNMNNISCYNVAISDCKETLTIFTPIVPDAAAVSSACDAHNKIAFGIRKINPVTFLCPAISLNEFFVVNNISSSIDLLVVDTEGYEYKILKAFDFLKWKPRVVIVEVHDQYPFPQYEEQVKTLKADSIALIELMLSYEYEIHFRDSLNVVFVKD